MVIDIKELKELKKLKELRQQSFGVVFNLLGIRLNSLTS